MNEIIPSRRFLAVFLLLILFAHGWATLTSAYFFYWWLDIVMHFTGGLWIGTLALYFLRNQSFNIIILLWMVIGLAAIVGLLWEFLEFVLNRIGFPGFPPQEIIDTLSDLLNDLLGGLAAFALFKKRRYHI